MARGTQCDHGRGCTKTDLFAQFTKPLYAVVKGDKVPQPQFYCISHRSKHPNVSPTTGRPVGRR